MAKFFDIMQDVYRSDVLADDVKQLAKVIGDYEFQADVTDERMVQMLNFLNDKCNAINNAVREEKNDV